MGSAMEERDELRRGPWTIDEDTLLIHSIARYGEGQWNSLAKLAGLKRTGKSCRLRWLNYLKPDVKRGNLTVQEQLLILELHSKWGNRWSKIAQQLPGRTDNEIKNYWRTRVQKQARQLKMEYNSKRLYEAVRHLWMPLPSLLDNSSSSSSIHDHINFLNSSSSSTASHLQFQPNPTSSTSSQSHSQHGIENQAGLIYQSSETAHQWRPENNSKHDPSTHQLLMNNGDYQLEEMNNNLDSFCAAMGDWEIADFDTQMAETEDWMMEDGMVYENLWNLDDMV